MHPRYYGLASKVWFYQVQWNWRLNSDFFHKNFKLSIRGLSHFQRADFWADFLLILGGQVKSDETIVASKWFSSEIATVSLCSVAWGAVMGTYTACVSTSGEEENHFFNVCCLISAISLAIWWGIWVCRVYQQTQPGQCQLHCMLYTATCLLHC